MPHQKVTAAAAIYVSLGFGAAFSTALVLSLAWHFWHYGTAFSF